METGSLSRNSSLLCCLSGIILLFMVACHAKSGENSRDHAFSETTDDDVVELYELSDLSSEFTPQAVSKIKDMVANTMLPVASGKNREELNEVLKHLNNIQQIASAYFEDSNNIIEYLKIVGRISIILAKLNPDNFAANRDVSSYHIITGQTIDNLAQSEEDKRLGEEYKKKGLQAAKELVEKFPDNAMSYAQLAHYIYILEGDTKKAANLINHCLDLDEKSEYCQNYQDILTKKIETSSP